MLVLALQFSRGDVTHAELCPRSLERARRSGVDESVDFHSLKTEEKTVTAGGRCSREGPNPCRPRGRTADSPPVHQQVCLGWTVRMTIFSREALLRKEVIQPHLPVRLPCYDFTPITDPTFDGSLPYGLGHRLRVLPTFVV
jgi:hypothetical protein